MTENGLVVKDLRFSFGQGNPLLDGVSFHLSPGETVALLGVNGSGKTTLLRVLTGFLKRATGDVLWNGRSVSAMEPAEIGRCVALVDMDGGPLFETSVAEMIRYGRSPHIGFWGRFSEADDRLALAAARRLGLESFLGSRFQKLSKGEQQRVRLAMALAGQPGFLLLDEPTSHLDPGHQRETLRLVRELATGENIATLAVLHDINLARFFDRIMILHQGRIFRDGPPQQVLSREVLDVVYGPGVFQMRDWNGLPAGVLDFSLTATDCG